MEFHDHALQERQVIVLTQVFFQHDELEIAHGLVAGQTFIAADDIHFLVRNQVFHHFTEHEVDAGLHAESESEIDADDVVRNDVIHFILAGIGIVDRVDVYQPIDVGSLGFFIEDGVDDLVFDLVGIVCAGHVH